MMFGMMGFGWILLLLVVAAVVFALGWRPQSSQKPPDASGGSAADSETPMEILKARYARGEISQEEYDRMRQDLTVS